LKVIDAAASARRLAANLDSADRKPGSLMRCDNFSKYSIESMLNGDFSGAGAGRLAGWKT
jgi:hypothetical protein